MLLHVNATPGERAGRSAVVFLHAFPFSSGMWAPQLDPRGIGWPAVAVDLRGFGASRPAGWAQALPSVETMADDVAETVAALGVRECVVCGLSMGGYVAMAVARRHPGTLQGLVLANTKMEADSAQRRADRDRLARTALREDSVRVIVEEAAPGFVGATTRRERPDVVARVDALVAAARADAVAWALRAMASRPDSSATLRQLPVPALVVAGEEDVVCSPAMARAMASAAPQAETAWLPRSGHLSSMETPGAFNRTLSGWLERLAPPRG